MTQKTKLEIIGPYTREHEGPFCLNDENCTPVEVKIRDGRGKYPVMGYAGDGIYLRGWDNNGCNGSPYELMNAREVPVAREFWLIGGNVYTTPEDAAMFQEKLNNMSSSRLGIIHVREVLPGEGE